MVNVIAEGYDIKPFLERLVSAKSKNFILNCIDATPNIDFFTREELKEIVQKFKEDINNGQLDDSSKSSELDSSTANMFDVAMSRKRTMSMIRRKST